MSATDSRETDLSGVWRQTARIVIPDLTPALLPLTALLGALPRNGDGSTGAGGPVPAGSEPRLPPARWAQLRRTGTGLPRRWRRLPESRLWAAYQVGTARLRGGSDLSGSDPGGTDLLTLARHLAHRTSSPCRLCSLRCGARRQEGETGPCGTGRTSLIDRAMLLEGEEGFLGRGLAIYPSGCNVRPGCQYCLYPHAISGRTGTVITPGAMARTAARAATAGATHIHLIGGNMDQHLPYLLDLLAACDTALPLVYHTNGTSSAETMALVGPLASVISVDCRHGSGECAERLGASLLQPQTVQSTLERARSAGAVVVARVLALPGHLNCCTRPWLERLARMPDVWVNLMNHSYTPSFRAAADPDLSRPLSPAERDQADEWARSLGLRRIDRTQTQGVRA